MVRFDVPPDTLPLWVDWAKKYRSGSGEMTLDEFLASTGAVSEINKENAAANQSIGANLLSAGAEDDYVSSKDPLRYLG